MKILKRWSSEEDKYIKDHIGKITAVEMGRFLNRSHNSVRGRCKYLGINLRLPKRGLITFSCGYCGAEKAQPKWHYERMKNHFCSRKCQNNFARKQPCTICEVAPVWDSGHCRDCHAIYASVVAHRNWIKSGKNKHQTYQGMPFPDEWNPEKGGSYKTGTKDILKEIGPRPDGNWSIDVIQHDLGFVLGNLRWAQRSTQKRNQQHRILGQFSDVEFAVEARRRGYVLVPLLSSANILSTVQKVLN